MSTVTPKLGLTKPAGIEQFNLATYNNNLDVVDNYAINTVEKQSKGLVYQLHVATSSGSITGATVVHNIPTFTFKANRKYRIIWDFSYYMTGNSDSLFYCQISFAPTADAANLTTNLTSTDGRTKFIQTFLGASTGYVGPVTKYHQTAGTDQTTQIKFLATRVYGDDGLVVVGNVNERVVYSIYDDGEQAGSFG